MGFAVDAEAAERIKDAGLGSLPPRRSTAWMRSSSSRTLKGFTT